MESSFVKEGEGPDPVSSTRLGWGSSRRPIFDKLKPCVAKCRTEANEARIASEGCRTLQSKYGCLLGTSPLPKLGTSWNQSFQLAKCSAFFIPRRLRKRNGNWLNTPEKSRHTPDRWRDRRVGHSDMPVVLSVVQLVLVICSSQVRKIFPGAWNPGS